MNINVAFIYLFIHSFILDSLLEHTKKEKSILEFN